MRLRTVAATIAAALLVSPLFAAAPAALADPPNGAPVLTSTSVPDSGAVLLTWQGVPAAAGYTAQLALDPSFTTIVESTDTTALLWAPTKALAGTPESGPRTYYWRVRAYGSVTTDFSPASTSETGQFTRAALPAPTQVSPAADGTIAYPDPVVFRWAPVPGATNYTLEYGTDASFQTVTSQATTATSFVPQALLSRDTPYYWRVTATLGALKTPASGVSSFMVTWPNSAPTLLAPNDGSTMSDVEFRWSPVAGAAYYTLDVATNDAFSPVTIKAQKVIGTRFSADEALKNESYWWRVIPYDANGKAGTTSMVGQFRRAWGNQQGPELIDSTTSDYPEPLVGAPAEGAAPTVPVDSLELSWDALPRATYYEVQVVAASENFDTVASSARITCFTPNTSATVIQKSDQGSMTGKDRLQYPSGGSGCLQPKSGLALVPGDAVLKWRVRAVDLTPTPATSFQTSGEGQLTSAWSDSSNADEPGRRFFRVGDAVQTGAGIATPVSPDPGSDVRQAPVLRWTPVTGQLSYRVEVALDDKFTNRVVTAVVPEPLLRLDGALADNTTSDSYYWRVTACAALPSAPNLLCDPTSGPTSSFHKISSPLVLHSPVVDTITNTVRVSWAPPTVGGESYDGGVRGYQTQVSTTNAFNNADILHDAKTDLPFLTSTMQNRALANGTYYVRTRALDAAGQPFGWSSPKSFDIAKPTPVPDTVPNDASPTLTWYEPSGMALATTSYDVRYWLASGNAPASPNVTTRQYAAATVPLSGSLAPGTYKWQVRAKDAFGTTQGWSAIGDFVVGGAAPALTTPDGVQFGIADRAMSWQPVPSAASYVLRTATNASMTTGVTSWPTMQTTGTPKAAFSYGTTYYWDVQALSSAGTVLATSPARTFTVRTVPAKPTLGSLNVAGDTLNVTWAAASGATNGSADAPSYWLRYRAQGGGEASWMSVGPLTGTAHTITALPMNTTFEVQLGASNSEGQSPWSATKTATTKGLPTEPRSLAVMPSAGQAKLSWTAPATVGAGVSGYHIRYTYDGGPWTADVTTADRTFTLTDLVADMAYTVEVRAYGAYGDGPPASLDFVGVAAPGAPTLTAATPGDRSAALQWTVPTSTGGSPVTGYVVEMRSKSGSTWSSWATKASTTATTVTTTVTGLTNGTPYEFQVRAKNKYGAGDPSTARQVVPTAGGTNPPPTPPKVTAPSKVSGLKAVSKKKRKVVLTWSPAAANGARITGYQIQYRLASKAWNNLTTATTTSYTWAKGKARKKYAFRVRAMNAKGPGAYSNAVTVKVKK